MPLNEKGEGPEMDQSKVRCVMYQVWDSNNVVVREYFSPRKAEAVCRKMNEYNNGKT